MGEPKTVPTDANVHDFLNAAATARRREEGLRLAELFGEVTGADPVMWGPTMVGYGSFLYISRADPRRRGNWFKTGFSPRKAQLSFYGLNDLPESTPLLQKLGTHTEGVSCVYARKLDDIDLEVLRQLI